MILVKYLETCIAFLKQVWSSIRSALPVVTWPSRVGSTVPVAAQQAAPTAVLASPEAITPENTLVQVIAHLEYLGYEVRLDPEGWSHAQHPYRYDFHLRCFPQGIRLDCGVGIGAAIGNSRVAWLEFLNTANERGQIVQFSLFEDNVGRHVVRMCAFVSGAYSRPAFAMAMDMWHHDLDLVRRKPAFPQASAASENDNVAVTVN
jgi:hypothetical protein